LQLRYFLQGGGLGLIGEIELALGRADDDGMGTCTKSNPKYISPWEHRYDSPFSFEDTLSDQLPQPESNNGESANRKDDKPLISYRIQMPDLRNQK
jgi:hypothetical protein